MDDCLTKAERSEFNDLVFSIVGRSESHGPFTKVGRSESNDPIFRTVGPSESNDRPIHLFGSLTYRNPTIIERVFVKSLADRNPTTERYPCFDRFPIDPFLRYLADHNSSIPLLDSWPVIIRRSKYLLSRRFDDGNSTIALLRSLADHNIPAKILRHTIVGS